MSVYHNNEAFPHGERGKKKAGERKFHPSCLHTTSWGKMEFDLLEAPLVSEVNSHFPLSGRPCTALLTGRVQGHKDYFELKSNQNTADLGKALYFPPDLLKRIWKKDLVQEESYQHRKLHDTMNKVWQIGRNLARPVWSKSSISPCFQVAHQTSVYQTFSLFIFLNCIPFLWSSRSLPLLLSSECYTTSFGLPIFGISKSVWIPIHTKLNLIFSY